VTSCSHCGGPLAPDAAFCGQCGRPAPRPTAGLRFVIAFYLAMLGVQTAGLIYVQVTDDVFPATVATMLGLVTLTLAFAIPHRALVLPTYRRAGFGPSGYGLILLAAPIVCALVLGYVHGLATLFGIHVPSELEGLDNLAIAVLLIVVLAPLDEELAFRGLIFGALRTSLTLGETFLISSFAFAMLHLSLPSLLTHFPLGLYLCWLRHRSNSLWPPIFAHACHNLGVIFAAHHGWA
jgi:membrane protease YdiL (CAAX protease family)